VGGNGKMMDLGKRTGKANLFPSPTWDEVAI
jgi:hypothetical protein